jgi:hypothetical protein
MTYGIHTLKICLGEYELSVPMVYLAGAKRSSGILDSLLPTLQIFERIRISSYL